MTHFIPGVLGGDEVVGLAPFNILEWSCRDDEVSITVNEA